jgi:hypothetical protein
LSLDLSSINFLLISASKRACSADKSDYWANFDFKIFFFFPIFFLRFVSYYISFFGDNLFKFSEEGFLELSYFKEILLVGFLIADKSPGLSSGRVAVSGGGGRYSDILSTSWAFKSLYT